MIFRAQTTDNGEPMTNRPKIKGTAAETAVVTYLRDQGFPHAERRSLRGTHDRGDIAGIPGVAIEVKNCARLELAAWLDEAATERTNDGADYGAVWHKRRGQGNAGNWFVTIDGATFTRILRDLGYGNQTNTSDEAA
jgi:hypothetical protein